MIPPSRQSIIASLRQARKYAHLCPDTVERVADWALVRHREADDALKAAKRKLHQVFAAYLETDPRRLGAALADVDWHDDAAVRATARQVLAMHASSAERLAQMETLYPALWAALDLPGACVPASVLDIACGLHPFALPWMGLPPTTRYLACDIDRRLTDAVGTWLRGLGQAGETQCRDILARPWDEPVDVALLFKTAPCLEQQEEGATRRIIMALRARRLVLSFPARSLGGHAKGMTAHYRQWVHDLAGQLGRPVREVSLPHPTHESYYVLPGVE